MKVRLRDKLRLWVSPIPNTVLCSETVTRYVYSSGKYRKGLGKLHRTAFQPPRAYPTEVSVYRATALSVEEVWELAIHAVKDETPVGYGNLKCETVRKLKEEAENDDEEKKLSSVKLDLEAYPHPHFRHANIVNLPKAETPTEKAMQKLVTMKLANKSSLVLKP